jgi:pimeloyl-ACP methyl ester carboxylesterase
MATAAAQPRRAAVREQARTLRAPDGTAIAYRVGSSGAAGVPVVLLHGLASNLTRWSEFVERTTLGARHPLIRVDLRGHGDSPTRCALSLERWCDDLVALLDAEGAERAILIGHSLGAQIALHFAARAPQRTAALVLIDPVLRRALHGRWRLLAQLGPLIGLAAGLLRGVNALGLRRRTLPPLDLRALDEQARVALAAGPSAVAEFVRRYSSTRADLRTFRSAHYLQELVEMFRPPPEPRSIHAPMLVLLSAGATFAGEAQTRALLARFGQVEVQAIECQHWPLTERPDEVRDAIERWCTRCFDGNPFPAASRAP